MFARQIPRLVRQTVRRYGHDSHFKPPTMDELPVPRGSWQAKYDADQKHYNTVLAVGVLFSVGTIAYASQSDYFFLNWAPPDTYE